MDVLNLVDHPNVTQVNLKTIYNGCHGLVTSTQSSPQRGQHFANIVKMRREITCLMNQPQLPVAPRRETSADNTSVASTTPENPAENKALDYFLEDPTIDNVDPPPQPKNLVQTANCLIVDVPTRWNSSYHMFRRLLRLREACDDFCKEKDFKKYALLPIEWNYIQKMCDFLEPLSEATNILCKSKYPTMHQVIPMYVVVLQGLKSVSN